jgi:hypothetical protein
LGDLTVTPCAFDGLDFSHGSLGKLGSRVGLTVFRTRVTATLRDHVPAVVEVRSEKQVRGVYAEAIVAVVADEQALRDRAVGGLPSKAVRIDDLPAASIELAVANALDEDAALPLPATFFA